MFIVLKLTYKITDVFVSIIECNFRNRCSSVFNLSSSFINTILI